MCIVASLSLWAAAILIDAHREEARLAAARQAEEADIQQDDEWKDEEPDGSARFVLPL